MRADLLSIQATEGRHIFTAKEPRHSEGPAYLPTEPHIDCPPRLPRAPHTDKEPLLEYQNILSKSAVTISDMERALSDFWGTQAQTGPFKSWDGSPNLTFLFVLYLFFYF